MRPLKAFLAAAAAARQWLRVYLAAPAKWRRVLPAAENRTNPSSAMKQQEQVLSSSPSRKAQTGEECGTHLVEALDLLSDSECMEQQQQQQQEHISDSKEITQRSLPFDLAGPVAPKVEELIAVDEETIRLAVLEITRLLQSGVKLEKQLLHSHPKSIRCRIVAEVLQNLTDGKMALEFFRWAADKAGCKHNTFTTNSLLLTLVKSGHVRKAYKMFKRRLPRGCSADRLTVSTILYGLCDSGQLHRACEFCDRIKRAGVFPYGRVLNTLIQALCNAGNVDRALKIGRELSLEAEDCSYTYGILIHALCKLRRLSLAWKLFYELRGKGGKVEAQVYGSLMHGLCKTGNVRKACNLLEEMAERGCSVDAIIYNTLIDGFCKAQKVEQALELFNIMNTNGFDASVVTYTALIDGLSKAQDVDKASVLLQKMVDRGCMPNVVTYSALIDGFCKSKRLEEAIDMVKHMLSHGVEPDLVTYNSLIHGFCISQKVVEAGWIFEELIEKGFAPNHITYGILIIANCRSRRLDRALNLLREMINRGSVCHLVIYIDLIYGFCEAHCGNRGHDGCCAGDEVGPLYKALEEMVRGCSEVVFEGDSYYDPISRLDKAEQVLEFMYHKGCVGDEERFYALQEALICLRKLKTPELEGGTSELPFGITNT